VRHFSSVVIRFRIMETSFRLVSRHRLTLGIMLASSGIELSSFVTPLSHTSLLNINS
jgi:hypothetical protein